MPLSLGLPLRLLGGPAAEKRENHVLGSRCLLEPKQKVRRMILVCSSSPELNVRVFLRGDQVACAYCVLWCLCSQKYFNAGFVWLVRRAQGPPLYPSPILKRVSSSSSFLTTPLNVTNSSRVADSFELAEVLKHHSQTAGRADRRLGNPISLPRRGHAG